MKSFSWSPLILCVQLSTRHLAPGEVDVGVVLLALGELTHAGGELHRLAEILERVRPLDPPDPAHVDHSPILALGCSCAISASVKRGGARPGTERRLPG